MNQYSEFTPSQIFDLLNTKIIGQPSLKKAVSIIIYNTLRWRCTVSLIYGKTGTGKSEVWRVAQTFFPDFIYIADGTQIGAPGYRGQISITEYLKNISERPSFNNNMPFILVIDEADKMFTKHVGGYGTDYTGLIQNSLLKVLDGDTITCGDGNAGIKMVNCNNISIVLTGAFTKLQEIKENPPAVIGFNSTAPVATNTISIEDFIQKAGIMRELAGRIQRIVKTDDVTADVYYGITKQVRDNMEREYNTTIHISTAMLREISQQAMKSNLGARYIKRVLLSYLDDALFENPNVGIIHIKKGDAKDGLERII